jgi:hypothetical protein
MNDKLNELPIVGEQPTPRIFNVIQEIKTIVGLDSIKVIINDIRLVIENDKREELLRYNFIEHKLVVNGLSFNIVNHIIHRYHRYIISGT